MDIKEIGICGVFVVGGGIYGVTQLGLGDALSEDIRHISEVSAQERPAYMETITAEFTNAFDTYGVETETYIFVGVSEFKTSPGNGTFVETVRQDTAVPKKEIKALRATMEENDFCSQDEMTMFTAKGWSYRFTMVDSKGRRVFATLCEPSGPKLRGIS